MNAKWKKVVVAYFAVLNYTREAGVRELERKLAAVCRAIAVQMAEKDCNQSKAISHISSDTPMEMPIVLDQANIEAILGVRPLSHNFSQAIF